MMWTPFAVLGPELKIFLALVSIIGPVAIAVLVFIIKRIEKENPGRIRWR